MRAHQTAALPPVASHPADRLGGALRRASISLIAGAGAMLAAQAASAQTIVQSGFAVVTGYSGFVAQQPPDGADQIDYFTLNPEGPSAQVVDLTTLGAQGAVSDAPKPFTVTASQVGQVFGVTLDKAKSPNIYLAASSAYGLSIFTLDDDGNAKRIEKGAAGAQFAPGQFGPQELGGGPGSVWRVDGQTGEISLLTTIDGGTGSVAALGGLAFDPVSSQFFVAERGTGIIYRFGLDGVVDGTYDHGVEGRPAAGLPPIGIVPSAPVNIESPAFDTTNPATWGVAPPARRVFGLAIYNKRIYYGVAQGPQIWSAAISPSGAVSGARLEVEVPSLSDGVEISSITFDGQGRMYLAERGATTGDFSLYQLANEGQSRVMRYVPKPVGDPSPGRWRLSPDVYSVGYPPGYANANGGVALNYGYRQDGRINLSACGATLWSTGERLLDPGDGSEGFPTVDGLQGNSPNLFQPQNTPPTQSWFVDYDDQPGDANFRGYMGAIATIPCAGAPTPPPVVCPPGTYFQNGQCLLYPTCPPGTTFQRGQCVYPQCPPNYVLRQGQCVPPPQTCPPNSVYYQGQCVPLDCPPGLTRLPNGYCACPPNNNYFNGKCVPPQACPPGSIQLGGICFCPEGLLFKNGKCAPFSCPPNQILTIEGKCEPIVCPPGQQVKNGQCVPITCKPFQDLYNGVCVPKCQLGWIHTPPNGLCKPLDIGPFPPLCNLTTHDLFKGQCLPKCVFPQKRQPNGSCGLIIGPFPPLCDLSTHDMFKGQCLPKCVFPQKRQPNGSCGLIIGPFPPLCDLSTHDMFKGQCLPKCVFPQKRQPNGSCGLIIGPFPPLCDLSKNDMFKGQCLPKCKFPLKRQPDGSCGVNIGPIGPIGPLCDLSTHDLFKGQCLDKCVPPKVRQPNGSCQFVFKPIGPILIQPKLILPLICANDEEVYNGACTKKCLPPQVRLKNGSCGLQFQLPLQKLEIQPMQ